MVFCNHQEHPFLGQELNFYEVKTTYKVLGSVVFYFVLLCLTFALLINATDDGVPRPA